ncbi:uncharacterized protein LOC112596202 [Melanaphis sacchari]|uniref:uncharacterized protein LOC112596202 n=1 Tax=Melanaphis sacchari TaxID=742174 RepID=UPI000DC13B5D|nr:uncharacterized protein LOC112596202 [Melanaphis sacchari]
MNPDIKDQNDENDDFKAIETLLKTYRSHNYIEKKKAIKSNAFQHPYNIKKSLGDTLGDIVINLIPKEDLIQMKEIEKVPLHFEVTAKNVLSNNIKLTPAVTDDDTTELNFNTIMRVGDRLKRQAEIKLNDEHDKALQRQVERLIADKNKTLNEKIRPMERSIYEKNLSVIMEEFDNSKIAVTQSISIV